MAPNFEEIKAKYKSRAIILSAVLCVCCALILCCTLLLIFKLTGVKFMWALYIPIGLVAAAGLFFAFYFALRPDDKKLSKKLDGELELNEKVQTMIECSADGGVMAKLQREQADGALSQAAAKRLPLYGLLKFAIVPVLAAAMLLVGIFVPAKKEALPEPDYSVTDFQLSALIRLAEEVSASDLNENVASAYVQAIEGLAEALKNTAYSSEMKEKVVAAIDLIDAVTMRANTYMELGGAMTEEKTLRTLAYSLSDGANAYKDGAYKLTSMDSVKQKQVKAEESANDYIDGWLGDYFAEFNKIDEEKTDKKAAVALALKEKGEALSSVLAPFAEDERVSADALYQGLTALAETFERFNVAVSGYSNASSYAEAAYSGILTRVGALAKPVAEQSYNLIMDDYVRTRLCSIFGVSAAMWQTRIAKLADEGGEEAGDDSKPSGSGGLGDGDLLGGTEDKIFDPELNDQNFYMLMLSDYSDAAMDILAAKLLKGEVSPEVETYVRLYFDALGKVKEDKS